MKIYCQLLLLKYAVLYENFDHLVNCSELAVMPSFINNCLNKIKVLVVCFGIKGTRCSVMIARLVTFSQSADFPLDLALFTYRLNCA